jgi:hypothetical protein
MKLLMGDGTKATGLYELLGIEANKVYYELVETCAKIGWLTLYAPFKTGVDLN